MRLLPALLAIVFAAFFWSQAHAHDMPGVSPELNAWYQNAETNVEARTEVVDVKYIIRPDGKEGWRWNDHGTIKDIPDVIIHWQAAAPDNKPTLFVYLGVMTCFYPPQGGA